MSNIVDIPRSNTFRFIRYDTYGVNKPTIDNLFHYDQKFTKTWTKNNYVQKINISDKAQVHITTNYESVTLGLYDFDFDLVSTISPVTKLTYEDGLTRVLHYDIDTSLLGGKYYLQFDFEGAGRPTQQYVSEWFSIADYSELTYFRWYGSETDGILWDPSIIMGFRIEAFWANPEIEPDIQESDDYNNSPIVRRAQPTRKVTLKTIPVPQYVAEKLALGCSHDLVYLNDMEFAPKQKSEQENEEGTGLVIFTQELYDKNYENYTTFVSDDTPPSDNVLWAYSDVAGDIVRYSDVTGDNILLY